MNTEKRLNEKMAWQLQHLVGAHFKDGAYLNEFFENAGHVGFLKWYFTYTGRPSAILQNPGFIRTFKGKYAIQGVKGTYLQHLQDELGTINEVMKNGEQGALEVSEAYFTRNRHNEMKKDIYYSAPVFYYKLAHTLRPFEYPLMDSPMVKSYGLKGTAFENLLATRDGYNLFISRCPEVFKVVRDRFIEKFNRSVGMLDTGQLSDYKLIDIHMWKKVSHKKH